MRKLLLLILLTAALSVADHGTAFACSCAELPGPEQALQDADAVFAGRVTETSTNQTRATIEVTRVWKGALPGNTVRMQGESSDGMISTCDIMFEEGQEYLIYGSQAGEGAYQAFLCSRSTILADADADLAALGPGSPPSTSTEAPDPTPAPGDDVPATTPATDRAGSTGQTGGDTYGWALLAAGLAILTVGAVVLFRPRLFR